MEPKEKYIEDIHKFLEKEFTSDQDRKLWLETYNPFLKGVPQEFIQTEDGALRVLNFLQVCALGGG